MARRALGTQAGTGELSVPSPEERGLGSRWRCSEGPGAPGGVAKDLQKQLERSFLKLFAMQRVTMQKLYFYRLEKEFSVLFFFYILRDGSRWQCWVYICKPAGRGPLSLHMSVKWFGCSSLRLLFSLPTVSPGCKAPEVVGLCSEVPCFALAQQPRAFTPGSVQTTAAHVNRAGNNT